MQDHTTELSSAVPRDFSAFGAIIDKAIDDSSADRALDFGARFPQLRTVARLGRMTLSMIVRKCAYTFVFGFLSMVHERQLLGKLEVSLLGIISAITQTPSDLVRSGRVATSITTAKVTGAATSAGLFGLVSTFGTAGTGTAIGTLSGAASISATLAWIGGLVGGGAAAGAVVLPLVGVAAGTAATMAVQKKFFSRQRPLADLQGFERKILFATDTLLLPLSEIARGEHTFPSETELKIFAHDGVRPLLMRLQRHLTRPVDQNSRESETCVACTIAPKHYKARIRHVHSRTSRRLTTSRSPCEPPRSGAIPETRCEVLRFGECRLSSICRSLVKSPATDVWACSTDESGIILERCRREPILILFHASSPKPYCVWARERSKRSAQAARRTPSQPSAS